MKNSIFTAATLVAVTVVGMTALVSAKQASAQTPINPILPVKGTKEISLSGFFQFDPDTNINLNVGYGYFFNRNLELGGEFNYSNPAKGNDSYGIGAVLDYHFPTASALLPFVGVNAGYADAGGNTDSYFRYGVRAGVKYFLNQNVSANAILQYSDTDQTKSESDFRLNLGLSIYLR